MLRFKLAMYRTYSVLCCCFLPEPFQNFYSICKGLPFKNTKSPFFNQFASDGAKVELAMTTTTTTTTTTTVTMTAMTTTTAMTFKTSQ